MPYREGIIDAIKLHRKGTNNGPSFYTIREHVRTNFPSDKKWNGTMFQNELKKMRHDGDLVQLELLHYKFSTDFEKKLLEIDVVDTRQNKMTVKTTATTKNRQLKDEAAAANRK